MKNKDIMVTILGEKWKIKFVRDKHPVLNGESNGFTYYYKREILINEDVLNNEGMYNHVLKHEIIHAFHIESGLKVYVDEIKLEPMLDWYASNIPKIHKVYAKLGIL